MTQETTPASDPRLDEWEKLANAAIEVEREYHEGNIATQYRLDSGARQTIHEALSDSAFEAIPALIAMARERDAALVIYQTAYEKADRAARAAEADRTKILAEALEWRGMAETAEARATAAEARVAELNRERDEARAQTSQVAKVLAWEPPYQAGLHKRVEAIIHRAEVAEARATAAEAKVVELEGELDTIVRGRYDGIEVTHYSADECRNIARAALRR